MAYPVRGSGRWDPTPEEVEARIDAHARGESYFVISERFGITPSACKQFRQRHWDEIEERRELLKLGITDRLSQLWVMDATEIHELRQHLIEDTLRRRAAQDLPDRDVSRYNRDIDAMAYKASELAGLVKQRTQAEVEVTSTIPLGKRLIMTDDGKFHEVQE